MRHGSLNFGGQFRFGVRRIRADFATALSPAVGRFGNERHIASIASGWRDVLLAWLGRRLSVAGKADEALI